MRFEISCMQLVKRKMHWKKKMRNCCGIETNGWLRCESWKLNVTIYYLQRYFNEHEKFHFSFDFLDSAKTPFLAPTFIFCSVLYFNPENLNFRMNVNRKLRCCCVKERITKGKLIAWIMTSRLLQVGCGMLYFSCQILSVTVVELWVLFIVNEW